MDRRKFIKSAGIATGAAAAAATLSAPAIAQAKKDMVIVATWPRDFPGLGTGAQRLAARIGELTEGRIAVQYFAAGERVGAFDSFDEVASGNAQAYHAADYYWKGKHPAWAYYTSVPFGLTHNEQNAWINFMGGQALWDEVASGFGLKCLMAGSTGVQMGGWFNKEINSPADLKGLKMRIPGMGGEALRRAGGTPVTLPGAEIFTSLQTGAIDATEWVGPYNDLSFGLHKAARYYYYPGWHEPGSGLECMINGDAWKSLPADLQEIVRTTCQAIDYDMLTEYIHGNAIALHELAANPDIEIRQFPDDVLEVLKSHVQDIVNELSAVDPMAAKIQESYERFLTLSTANLKISEQAYLETRK